ncbi:MAG TPA: sigma factor-like helix-turn-helix DNA-binding protein [Haliangiales bacterium]|nr:sigma factor-like helix-turn-helix DNA-binding protein [Haliangiales bacterium]
MSRPPDTQSVELRAAIARARSAWPTFSLGEEAFAAHLARVLSDQPAEAWAHLHVADLYLACACAAGDAGALAAFEAKMWPEIDAALARVRLAPDKRQDVMQDLRIILFVGSGKGSGKIAQYRGQGDLRRWLRAAALRAGFRIARKAKRELALDDVAMASVAVIDRDPGLAHLKETCRAELKKAFEAALAALPRRERLLLRQHHLDRLTIDDLAALHQVHRATAARWIAQAREQLTDGILRELGQRLQVPARELQSLLRLVRSQLDISLDRLLSVR